VSEQILDSTSAQLGYTMPFTLVHAGRYRTEDKLEVRTIHKLNSKHIQKKANHITVPMKDSFIGTVI